MTFDDQEYLQRYPFIDRVLISSDEIQRRGVPVRHLQSWDDFDRFRKVPHGVDESWNDHIGRPLSAVPASCKCKGCSWRTPDRQD